MPSTNIQQVKEYLNQLRTKVWFRVITISLLSFALSYSFLYQLISSPIFALQNGNDYEMSDFYNQVANNRPIRSLNKDIVIVGIDNCSRLDIANLVDIINFTQPAAIGLDVFFTYTSDVDSTLIATFNNTSNLVLAYDAYQETNTIFASSLPNVHWGSINLIAKQALGTIRQFRPQFNDSLYAFSATLAQLKDSTAFAQLLQRNNTLETICYPSIEFEQISGIDILNGNINLFDLEDILHNKVVLLGDTHNPFDQHETPINHNTPGIIINAHILATILNHSYIESTPVYVNWIIAILISAILSFFIVKFQQSNVLKSYTTFAIRIFQLVIIILFLYIGCYIFAQHHYYCNFAPSLTMIALGVLAVAVEPVVYLILRYIIKAFIILYFYSKKLVASIKKK